MIANQFVLRAVEDVDKALELGLQRAALLDANSNVSSHQENLTRLQDQLWIVKSEVDSLTSNIQQRRSRPRVNLALLRSVLQNLHLSSSSATADPAAAAIVPVVETSIIQYVTICCYYTIVQESLQQLPNINVTHQYYSEVAGSTRWSLLYGLQIMPERVFRFASNLIAESTSCVSHTSDTATSDTAASGSWHRIDIDDVAKTASKWAHQVLPRLDKLVMIHNYQLVGIPRDTGKLVSSLWGLPLAAVREEVDTFRDSSGARSDKMTRKLGRIISEFPLKHDLEGRVQSIANYYDIGAQQIDQQSIVQLLTDMTSRTIELGSSTAIRKPGKLTRYWPTLLCTLIYGPSSVLAVWNARYEIAKFCQENILDFCAGLVYNWIWIPLQQVWSTVRHDEEHSAIAVMSQGSLDTEFNSLSRMIVQIVADNSDGNVDTELIAKQVQMGDLTQFMQIYENQLHHPIKNILSGKLVRSLLIQIQKTKVDGSLALNGIDKLLQSQQLVFGVVAMSPALLILYCLLTGAYRLVKLGRIWSNIGLYKLKLSSSLNNVERLLNYKDLEPQHDDQDLNTGLLALEIVSARLYGERLVPKGRKAEWFRDVDELVNANLSHASKLNVVNRLYHVYGKYF
ncbi:LAFE_0F16292g1_1 [Lachancea fermentati]|uniref:LAFE_0F16292g1_1 n=1 Tax=Lachancea fermentati TaxID=4955 RepID=A0A1G4MG62_LACFM|nr:LAFE_0F16292g1_1 [Lachancea fermentati]